MSDIWPKLGFLWLIYALKPDTIVVNVGDLMERWSNDIFKRYALPDLSYVSIPDHNCLLPSTRHRVLSPTIRLADNLTVPRRQSIAYFCNPNTETTVECIPACLDKEKGAKYPPVKTEDYMVKLCVLHILT